ncbi:alcohol dehydrogenase catalytic domain-containing protein [Brevibacterium yomogidense]|uniref:alcohol dehydrogenase catalytic domain-containing protein n=1 Tax=Brevibacterium yomogidense TaxID=946573 RepID=UPI0018DF5848|nr:alcohol dehydrogenase catalytic domain-containing protein [Brevibacterium yomogidense]
MRAVLYEAFGQPPSVVTVDPPTPPDHGVVITVEATGVCRSDWHAWSGHDDSVSAPHVPGHELVGRIVRAGAGVTAFSPGDRVTVPFVCGCGTCEFCVSGNAQVCPTQTQPGFTHWGSWAEEVVIHHADVNLVSVPEDLPAEAVLPLGCRFATAFRGLHDRAQLRSGEVVAVFGCGGVGLSAVMIARAIGAEVIAVDISADALTLAESMGAGAAVDSTGLTEAEVADRVRVAAADLGTADGPHVTVEALGVDSTLNAALLSLRPLGRHVQIGLLAARPTTAVPRIISLELSLLGSHGMAAGDYAPLLRLVADGRLRPQDLVTRTIELDEAPAALVGLGEPGAAGLTIIRP